MVTFSPSVLVHVRVGTPTPCVGHDDTKPESNHWRGLGSTWGWSHVCYLPLWIGHHSNVFVLPKLPARCYGHKSDGKEWMVPSSPPDWSFYSASRLGQFGVYIIPTCHSPHAHSTNYGRVLTLAHTTIISYSLYQRTVMEFGQMSLLEKYPEGICWSFNISAVLGVVIQVCIRFVKFLGILIFL